MAPWPAEYSRHLTLRAGQSGAQQRCGPTPPTGRKVRIGIHTGEVDLIGEGLSGASVYIARGIAAFARPAEILVSRTVKDLVAGSGIAFAERGGHNLIGLPEEWPLFAVTQSG